MKKTLASLFAAGLLAPAIASANDISYSYVDGGLALYPDFEDQTFIGIDATGSFAVTPDIFVFGGLKYLTDDLDLTAIHVGGGYRFEVAPATDIWGGLTIEYQEIEFTGRSCDIFGNCTSRTVSFDDTSLGIRGGLRHRLNEDFEVGGSARIVTGDLDYFGISGYGQYFLNQNLGVIGEVDLYDGELGLIGKVRFNF